MVRKYSSMPIYVMRVCMCRYTCVYLRIWQLYLFVIKHFYSWHSNSFIIGPLESRYEKFYFCVVLRYLHYVTQINILVALWLVKSFIHVEYGRCWPSHIIFLFTPLLRRGYIWNVPFIPIQPKPIINHSNLLRNIFIDASNKSIEITPTSHWYIDCLFATAW